MITSCYPLFVLLSLLYWFWCYVARLFFFFFKQNTAYERRISDWISDVCSSDLVHPQQAALHRHVVVRRPQAGGATVLAVPRMRVLVAEQVAAAGLPVPVGEVAGAQAVLARALVFQPVAAHLLRQRKQKRSEERRVGQGCGSTCRSMWVAV